MVSIQWLMIESFRCKKTKALWGTGKSRHFGPIKTALRKLDMLHAAHVFDDLRSPPGNHLEALSGDRQGQHSIKINTQWRICFVWRDGAHEIEIVDYH